jgi:hypothetical protein
MKFLILAILFPISVLAIEIDLAELQNVTQTIDRATLSPTENCEHCELEIDQESVQRILGIREENNIINTGYVGGEDYVIALKRTSLTPKKVRLKIEYGERVCDRIVPVQNPANGALGLDCLFYKTMKRSKTIHLDFSKASVLEGSETQSLRLILNKNLDQKNIKHKLQITNGHFDEINSSKRFVGLFGHEYEIEKRSGNRTPAVLMMPEYDNE